MSRIRAAVAGGSFHPAPPTRRRGRRGMHGANSRSTAEKWDLWGPVPLQDPVRPARRRDIDQWRQGEANGRPDGRRCPFCPDAAEQDVKKGKEIAGSLAVANKPDRSRLDRWDNPLKKRGSSSRQTQSQSTGSGVSGGSGGGGVWGGRMGQEENPLNGRDCG